MEFLEAATKEIQVQEKSCSEQFSIIFITLSHSITKKLFVYCQICLEQE